MVWYVIKLLVLLPLLAGMIWGSLWLTRKLQGQMNARNSARSARLVEISMISPGIRLAVIEFHGREVLVGATKAGLVRLAEAPVAATDRVPLIEDNL